MFTIEYASKEGADYTLDFTVELAGTKAEVERTINAARRKGNVIFLVYKGAELVARIDDIAAVINAQVEAVANVQ